ncbi:MAG: hypothetical protein QFX35_03375 [Candidatus Verstraetearchaeota archaeon]|nr:hypothetical protein [Candidatus Verstraetearchaeota archaeon]
MREARRQAWRRPGGMSRYAKMVTATLSSTSMKYSSYHVMSGLNAGTRYITIPVVSRHPSGIVNKKCFSAISKPPREKKE